MTFCEPVAKRMDWETPNWLFRQLDDEFHFRKDLCATSENAKVFPSFYSPEDDGLRQRWTGMCWLNPPYGKEIGKWIEKAWLSACEGDATVVCLLPVRSNCEWWKYVIQSEVRFIRKKLKFVGGSSVSMFPNCIAIFHAHLDPGGVMKVWEPAARTDSKGEAKEGE